MKVTVLGCGHAGGVPSVSAGWGRCDPENPRNRRRRPSVLVEDGETTILIDTSPDLREQLLGASVRRLDGVLYTHGHADHLHGIDDLRELNRAMQAPIDIYGDVDLLARIRERFGYVLEPLDSQYYYKPVLTPHVVTERFRVGGVEVLPFVQDHDVCATLGYRIGDFAYSTDAVNLDDAAFEALAGVRLWIVGALTNRPHGTHAHVDKALAWIERVGPERALLTHMSTSLDYCRLKARLPAHVEPGYDGMVIEL